MFQSKTVYGRLAEFREHLGLNKSEMAERLGLKQRAYNFYEAGERKIPPEALGSLSGLGLNLNWLSTGEGVMLSAVGAASVLLGNDTTQAFGHVGPAPYPAHATPGFPEKQIVRATELSYKILGVLTLTPTKMGWLIATIAEMLVRGRAEEEILAEAAPMAKALGYSGSSHSPVESQIPQPGVQIPK